MTIDIEDLIRKQRAAHSAPKTKKLVVPFGGEKVEVVLPKISPDEWQMLTAQNPPRRTHPSDSQAGYDQYAVPANYPRVTFGGVELDADAPATEGPSAHKILNAKWAEVFHELDSVYRNLLGLHLWNLNVGDVIAEFAALGKAGAGQQSSSPANRASRRAASKGGSQRKSPATTTPKDA